MDVYHRQSIVDRDAVVVTRRDQKLAAVFDQFLYAPIEMGEVVGSLRYSVNGITIADYPITATEDIRSVTNGWFTDYIRAIEEREQAG